MKRLYIHFYWKSSHPEPFESLRLFPDGDDKKQITDAIQCETVSVTKWLDENPEGKVEIKWEYFQ